MLMWIRVLYMLIVLFLGSPIPKQDTFAVKQYTHIVVYEDCDYMNDWLTHMTPQTRRASKQAGQMFCESVAARK